MTRASLPEEERAVRALALRLGLGPTNVRLVKAAHHTTLRLDPSRLIARVQSGEPPEDALRTAALELAVARHLEARGAPAVRPAAPAIAGPRLVGRCVVTLWPDLGAARPARSSDEAAAARALGSIHSALADFAGPLPDRADVLDRCRRTLDDPAASPALADDDRRFLQQAFERLRAEIDALGAPTAALHGDAHLGNVLVGPDGPVWIDIEAVCRGPLAHDVAGFSPRVRPLFATADPGLVSLCADLRSVCVAVWCWADFGRSAAVRKAALHHLAKLKAGIAASQR